MKATIGSAVILVLAFLVGGCKTHVGHIQREEPIRSLNFKGDHKSFAQCVHQHLGGRVQIDGFGDKLIIFQSAKSMSSEGLTHYSVTVGRYNAEEGFAEWRIVKPPATGQGLNAAVPPLTQTATQRIWGPVEQCAAQVKGS